MRVLSAARMGLTLLATRMVLSSVVGWVSAGWYVVIDPLNGATMMLFPKAPEDFWDRDVRELFRRA